MVVRRRHEIGIRIALGSGKAKILGLILREAVVLLAIGLVAGTVLAIATAGVARAMLFGLNPVDPLTMVLAVGSLAIVGVTATLFPAVRATAVDPMRVLREE
jgi:putative ABC transport system permease protein